MVAPSVLVIDDERGIRRTLAAYFEDEGMEVTTADSGEQALELVRGGLHPDVCIIDIRLPGIDGHETATALHELTPRARFIVHTGSSDYELPAVMRAEPFFVQPVRITNGQHSRQLEIVGKPPEPDLSRVLDMRLDPVPLPKVGLAIGDRVAEILHVRPIS